MVQDVDNKRGSKKFPSGKGLPLKNENFESNLLECQLSTTEDLRTDCSGDEISDDSDYVASCDSSNSESEVEQ